MNLTAQLDNLRADPDLAFLHAFSPDHVYLVGGAVRDWLLERETKDLDFLVVGLSPAEVVATLEQHGRVLPVESRAFGVFKFTPRDSATIYEVALPRRDTWTGLRYQDMTAEVGVSLAEDLARRDFTINALALSLTGELVDEYAGQEDLQARRLRAVGDPTARFLEDPSRILRGLRLACELDFTLEPATAQAMRDLAAEVVRPLATGEPRVAEEVVAAEFLRGFHAQPARLVRLWAETGLLALLLPEVAALADTPQPGQFHSEGGVGAHTLLALEELRELERGAVEVLCAVPLQPATLHAQLAVLLHDVGKPPTIQHPTEPGGRIRFPAHDGAGGDLAGAIVDRLRLTVFPREDPLHVDREHLIFLIRHHMLCAGFDAERIKLTTLERIFFTPEERGGELLALTWADISATVPPSGQPDYRCFRQLVAKINELAEVLHARREQRPLPHLLTGTEIMAATGLPAGPEIGRLKETLRGLQLRGELHDAEEARAWLRGR
ncbi:MAG TPA: hypothetical protein VGM19_01655 [Armatimonadota bacterium]|jgi:poly(A) polymerase